MQFYIALAKGPAVHRAKLQSKEIFLQEPKGLIYGVHKIAPIESHCLSLVDRASLPRSGSKENGNGRLPRDVTAIGMNSEHDRARLAAQLSAGRIREASIGFLSGRGRQTRKRDD